MPPVVMLILLVLFAAMNWGLFGWLIAYGIQRHRGLDALPVWLIVGSAAAGAVVALLYGIPALLLAA